MRPYRLRGSFVSLLLWAGEDLTYVAEQAGHSVATLARYYAGGIKELHGQPKIPAAEPKGFSEYVTLCFGFDDFDREAIFLDANNAVTVREWRSTPNLADATSYASEWIGEGLHQFPFENIPGLYQAAFFDVITGREHHVGLTWLWCLPAIGDHVPVRRFPPVLDTAEPATDPEAP
jgi:hypothetical protein